MRSQLRQTYSDKAKDDKEETKKNTMLGSHCLNTDLNVVSWGLKLLKDMLNDWFLRDIPLFEESFLPYRVKFTLQTVCWSRQWGQVAEGVSSFLWWLK